VQDLDVCLKRQFLEEMPIADSPFDNLLYGALIAVFLHRD
jgi:hypothetical protein